MRSTAYLLLTVAIAAEVIATSALRASEGFTRVLPSVIVAVGYGISFYSLSLTLRTLPVGIVYAIWSGAGTTLITLIAIFLFKQKPDAFAVLGMGLIVTGVMVLNGLSKMNTH
ncbi:MULTISPECIES: DMT family transporter [Caballeronia]|uniref:DMT family transporter n=1 Tax=Caballeronia TaxID=1827195 RepID=UPI001FD22FB2|nr:MULTISPECIES: multidrug efflux SMR transporter [Caballeronia]MDR5799148.1 multidrug efflux SMR transporter [Caballeronia sp. LZ001]